MSTATLFDPESYLVSSTTRSPQLTPAIPNFQSEETPPPEVRTRESSVSTGYDNERRTKHRRRTKPSQSDTVLLRTLDPNRLDIANHASQHALDSESEVEEDGPASSIQTALYASSRPLGPPSAQTSMIAVPPKSGPYHLYNNNKNPQSSQLALSSTCNSHHRHHHYHPHHDKNSNDFVMVGNGPFPPPPPPPPPAPPRPPAPTDTSPPTAMNRPNRPACRVLDPPAEIRRYSNHYKNSSLPFQPLEAPRPDERPVLKDSSIYPYPENTLSPIHSQQMPSSEHKNLPSLKTLHNLSSFASPYSTSRSLDGIGASSGPSILTIAQVPSPSSYSSPYSSRTTPATSDSTLWPSNATASAATPPTHYSARSTPHSPQLARPPPSRGWMIPGADRQELEQEDKLPLPPPAPLPLAAPRLPPPPQKTTTTTAITTHKQTISLTSPPTTNTSDIINNHGINSSSSKHSDDDDDDHDSNNNNNHGLNNGPNNENSNISSGSSSGGSGMYKCTVKDCPANPFPTQYLLNSHMKVHSDDRPHFCPILSCPRGRNGQGFKRKNEMIRHSLVHKSPGYACPFCPDKQQHKYPRADNLRRHVKTHHGNAKLDDPSLKQVTDRRPEGGTTTRGRRRKTVES